MYGPRENVHIFQTKPDSHSNGIQTPSTMPLHSKQDRLKAWTIKYRQLELYQRKYGCVSVQSVSRSPNSAPLYIHGSNQNATNTTLALKKHNRPLASWLYNQRKRFHNGALEPMNAKLLSQLDVLWYQFGRAIPR
jgi:hypothetical protein